MLQKLLNYLFLFVDKIVGRIQISNYISVPQVECILVVRSHIDIDTTTKFLYVYDIKGLEQFLVLKMHSDVLVSRLL